MKAIDRFLAYAKVSTASDPANEDGHPSTARQFDLAKKLVAEMAELGFENPHVDAHCNVYGWIPAAPGYEDAPALGLLAHMDTASDCSGENVKPILHENYDGGDVALPAGHTISAATFPELKALKGQTLVTASGDTLLGADDKAGIAEIMTACERVLCGSMPHGRLCVAFTPDEEIGEGTATFDVAKFGAKYAYTVDGGPAEEVEYESFNAATAKLTFKGVDVHPGSAKDIMVNAASLAIAYDGLLPAKERPEYTEGREGFYHLIGISGATGAASSTYIVRDHDRAGFEARKAAMRIAAETLEARYFPGSVTLELRDSYYNMGEVVEQHFHLVENAKQAVRAAGLEPVVRPIRGGTDGSALSFKGLPCPNLGTGGRYFHGPSECITVEAMDQAVEVLMNVIGLYARFGKD